MKKTILNMMLCSAAVLPFAACSSLEEDSEDAKKLNALTEIVTEGMQNSPETIALTAQSENSTETRAAIESDEKTKAFETDKDYLGVMMLAQSVLLNNLEYPEYKPYNYLKVNWNEPTVDFEDAAGNKLYEFNDTWSVPLKNVPAQALKTATGDKTFIELNVPTKQKYYPMGAYHNYWFYGYGPRQESLEVSEEGDEYSVIFGNLDGSQDVIYGKADDAKNHVSEAYSARWFRYEDNRTDDVANPVNMSYVHKMAQIRFHIKAGGVAIDVNPEYNRNYEPAYNTRIVSISITNAPSAMQLILANNTKKAAEREGLFVPYEGSARNREYKVMNIGDSYYPQPENPDAKKGDLDNKPKKTPIGDGLLVPPLDDYNSNPYLLKIQLEYPKKSGIYHELKVPMRLPLEKDAKIEAGKIYDVTLEIFAPEQINLNGTLEPWVQSTIQPFIGGGLFPVH